MKILSGNAYNIKKNLIGQITKRPLTIRKNCVYVINQKYKIPFFHSCYISKNNIKTHKPIICNVLNIEELNEGDIVLIKKDGSINVIFDTKLTDNSLFITAKCNCSCIMCPQISENKEERYELNMKIIDLISRNKIKPAQLGITGGEPTLAGDNLIKILNNCSSRLPNTKLSLLTNAILLENKEYANKIIDSTKNNITFEIPLYSDIDTIHNKIVGVNSFYKVINGIYNLASRNSEISIRFVIQKDNFERMKEFAEFIYFNTPFVAHVAFMYMETNGLAYDNIKKVWIDPMDTAEHIKAGIEYLVKRKMKVSIYNAQLCILKKEIWCYARKSISGWKNVYLEECNKCLQKDNCGGFFSTSNNIYSKGIKAIKNN